MTVPNQTIDRSAFGAIKRHPILSYTIVAYGLSWIIAVPLALQAQGRITLHVPMWWHYLTAYGPLIASVLVTWLTRGNDGILKLWQRLRQWRIGWLWFSVAAFSPVLLYMAILVGLSVAGKPMPTLAELGKINFLPELGLAAWVLWILNSGLGEEVGWRGFVLPRLQQTHSALAATLILGVLWAGWHLPFFFYLPSYRSMGLGGFPGFALSLMAGAVVLTWLYNSTDGSVFATMLWHGGFNFITASAAGQAVVAMIMSIIVMVWAGLIVLVAKPKHLSAIPKTTLE